MMRKLVALAVMCSALLAVGADEPAKTERERRLDTLRYGIESQVVDLLAALRAEKNDDYKPDILAVFDASTSAKLRVAVLDYFSALSLPDAEGRAAAILGARDGSEDSLVAAAFSYLIALKSKAALPEAARIIEDSEKRYLEAAIRLMGASGSDSDAAALLKAYKAEGVASAVKEQILLALGSMKAASSYELLAATAASDSATKVERMYACSALGSLGDERAIPVLARASTSSDPNVRSYAIAALRNFPGDKAAVGAIIQGLRDAHVLPRSAAAKASGDMRLEEAVPFLEYKASYDPEKSVREASIDALASIGGARIESFLSTMLEDPKGVQAYRIKAFSATIAKGGPEARAKALALLAAQAAEKDRKFFTALASAAVAIDAPTAEPFARLLLSDKEFSIRLGGIAWADRNKTLYDELKRLAETDPNETVRKRAQAALDRKAAAP